MELLGQAKRHSADGGITSGNWITGIPVIDEHVLGLGPQDEIAPDIADNKGRNKFYMLPLLLRDHRDPLPAEAKRAGTTELPYRLHALLHDGPGHHPLPQPNTVRTA